MEKVKIPEITKWSETFKRSALKKKTFKKFFFIYILKTESGEGFRTYLEKKIIIIINESSYGKLLLVLASYFIKNF